MTHLRVRLCVQWARKLECPKDADAWACLHGTPSLDLNASCTAEQIAAGATAAGNRTLVALVVLRAIVLRGARQSPLLTPGAAPRPPPGHHLSVAVRAGDACDVVRMQPLTPPYESKRLFQGMWDPRLRTAWSRQKRRCAHHSVYGRLAIGLLDDFRANATMHATYSTHARSRRVRTTLLASDSDEAEAHFRQMARGAPDAAAGGAASAARLPPVRTSRDHYNRSQMRNRRGGRTMDQWIEYREDLGADVPVSALEDLRLLAQGSMMVASMCSCFATLAWNLLVAERGIEVPYASVDSCAPHLEVWRGLEHTINDERERTDSGPTFASEIARGGPLWRFPEPAPRAGSNGGGQGKLGRAALRRARGRSDVVAHGRSSVYPRYVGAEVGV